MNSKQKRTLYGTLGIAMMGMMSSSFFGSVDHGIHSISLSAESPVPAPNPTGASKENATGPVAKTTPEAKPADAAATPSAPTPEKKETTAATPAPAAPATTSATPAVTPDAATPAVPAKVVVKKPIEEAKDKTIVITVKGGAKYAFKVGEAKTDVPDQWVVNDKGGSSQTKINEISATAARIPPNQASGTICERCLEDSEEVKITVADGATIEQITAKLKEEANRLEKLADKTDDKTKDGTDCDTPSEKQVKVATDAHIEDADDFATFICEAEKYSTLKSTADKKDSYEKLRKEMVDLETEHEALVDKKDELGKERDNREDRAANTKDLKENEKKMKLLLAKAKNSDLKRKLVDTQSKAHANAVATKAVKQGEEIASAARNELNEAYSICPSLQNANMSRVQNMGQQQCTPAEMYSAAYKRADALNVLNVEAMQMRRYSPNSLYSTGIVMKSDGDSGLTLGEMSPTFHSYVDFANTYQQMTRNSMLTPQDRRWLQGIDGMEQDSVYSRSPEMDSYGLNSPLVQNNVATGTFRTARQNSAQLQLTYPQVQGLNLNTNQLNNNNLIRPVNNLNSNLSLPNVSNTYMSGTYIQPNINSASNFQSIQPVQFAQTSAAGPSILGNNVSPMGNNQLRQNSSRGINR